MVVVAGGSWEGCGRVVEGLWERPHFLESGRGGFCGGDTWEDGRGVREGEVVVVVGCGRVQTTCLHLLESARGW